MSKTVTKKEKQALEAITAWRVLYYSGLMNDKEADNVKKKIDTRFKKYLSPLRKDTIDQID